ncbi:hypothetical protein LXL04_036770 [Taraxacum kok-saghyz]
MKSKQLSEYKKLKRRKLLEEQRKADFGASAERSFSKLKLLKSYLRSTMTQERLSGLAMISIKNEMLESINYEELINQFAIKNARRASRIIGYCSICDIEKPVYVVYMGGNDIDDPDETSMKNHQMLVTCKHISEVQLVQRHRRQLQKVMYQTTQALLVSEVWFLFTGLFDCTSDHGLGLGPRTRSGVCAFDSGPRTRSDILPQTRSGDKNRRLIFLPLMSDSVRSPRCLVGAFDVGLGPDSLRLDPYIKLSNFDIEIVKLRGVPEDSNALDEPEKKGS